MELQHINVKIPLEGGLTVDLEGFIEIFHEWIRLEALDELLIDVADYRHVPAGPGVMLIAHEANYSIDNTNERWGLCYNRKAPVEGDNETRLRQALRSVLNACRLLEARFADGGGESKAISFSRREFDLFINDRALAPNTRETYQACKPELGAFLKHALGHDEFTLQHHDDPRCRFGVTVTIARPFDLATLLNTLRS